MHALAEYRVIYMGRHNMATSSITANFCINDAQEARAFVDSFVSAAKRHAPLRRHAKISVMSNPAEIRRFVMSGKPRGAK